MLRRLCSARQPQPWTSFWASRGHGRGQTRTRNPPPNCARGGGAGIEPGPEAYAAGGRIRCTHQSAPMGRHVRPVGVRPGSARGQGAARRCVRPSQGGRCRGEGAAQERALRQDGGVPRMVRPSPRHPSCLLYTARRTPMHHGPRCGRCWLPPATASSGGGTPSPGTRRACPIAYASGRPAWSSSDCERAPTVRPPGSPEHGRGCRHRISRRGDHGGAVRALGARATVPTGPTSNHRKARRADRACPDPLRRRARKGA